MLCNLLSREKRDEGQSEGGEERRNVMKPGSSAHNEWSLMELGLEGNFNSVGARDTTAHEP
ncbi:hypothetical protein JOQ06_020561, partial [Pogonophryne albipinna]